MSSAAMVIAGTDKRGRVWCRLCRWSAEACMERRAAGGEVMDRHAARLGARDLAGDEGISCGSSASCVARSLWFLRQIGEAGVLGSLDEVADGGASISEDFRSRPGARLLCRSNSASYGSIDASRVSSNSAEARGLVQRWQQAMCGCCHRRLSPRSGTAEFPAHRVTRQRLSSRDSDGDGIWAASPVCGLQGIPDSGRTSSVRWHIRGKAHQRDRGRSHVFRFASAALAISRR